ncbi:MAG TPA: DUF6252 family protein [Bacteroidales bacterium]|nr:DUF6252 family protein [Bacteroidales bacterium]HRX97892.1 DUF6252 family protein [Bacteroidales bacterium]
MKKTNLIFPLLLVFAFILTYCSKDDNKDESEPSMTATIDGKSWSATQCACQYTQGIGGILGTAPQDKSITITILNFKEGTFLLNYTSESAASVTDGNVTYTTNSDPQAGGYVIISSINTADSTVSGTFDFVAYSPYAKGFINIKDGTFNNLPFSASLPNTPDQVFTVVIDDELFEPSSIHAMKALGKITISTSNADASKTVGITITESLEPGSYSFSIYGDAIGQYNLGTTVIMSSNSGKLNLTKHDKTNHVLEGTFYFEATEITGTNTASLSDGNFVVTY